MEKKIYTDKERAQLVEKVDQHKAQGIGTNEACEKVGIVPNNYYVWRRRTAIAPIETKRKAKAMPAHFIVQTEEPQGFINIISGPTREVLQALALLNQRSR